MNRIQILSLLAILMLSCPFRAHSASVEWNRTSVTYEGINLLDENSELYTMDSPYLVMTTTWEEGTLRVRAQPQVNLVSANTLIWLAYSPDITIIISPEWIYSASDYFAYAVYKGSLDDWEVRSDYSVFIDRGESVYLAFASQPATLTDPIACGWVELRLDDDGRLTAVRSAYDREGGSLIVGFIPEPHSALLLLVGGALLVLRGRINGSRS